MPATIRKRGIFGQPVDNTTSTEAGMRAPTTREHIWDAAQDKLDWVPSILKDYVGIPSRDIPRDDTQLPAVGVNWFSDKASRIASGENLITELRKKYPEGSRPRKLAEKLYKNYNRVFAHLGDVEETTLPGETKGRYTPERTSAFVKKPILDETGLPTFTPEGKERYVHKLNPDLQKLAGMTPGEQQFVKDQFPNVDASRKNILFNSMKLDPKKAYKPDKEYPYLRPGESTVRHEGIHLGQNIADPIGHGREVIAGRGQIGGNYRADPVNREALDYVLEPKEIGAFRGEGKGLNRSIRDSAGKRINVVKPQDEYVNKHLDDVVNSFKAFTAAAPEEAITYEGSIGNLRPKVSRKQTKKDLVKAEGKVFGETIGKLKNVVLPRINKTRPPEDPMVIALGGKELDPSPFILKSEQYGDFLRDMKVSRRSKTRK